MPIDRKNKIAFVHIPKTAGTSIEKCMGLYGYYNRGSNFIVSEIAYGKYPVNKQNRLVFRAETKYPSWCSHWLVYKNLFNKQSELDIPLQHLNYRELQKNYNLKNYFIFSFVRNPYWRCYSAYRWLNIKKPFEEFVVENLEHESKKNYYFFSQYSFLRDVNGKVNINFIGKFEYLEKDFEQLKTQCAITGQLEKIHYSPRDDNQSPFNKTICNKIHEIYGFDFDEFGYNANDLPLNI